MKLKTLKQLAKGRKLPFFATLHDTSHPMHGVAFLVTRQVNEPGKKYFFVHPTINDPNDGRYTCDPKKGRGWVKGAKVLSGVKR